MSGNTTVVEENSNGYEEFLCSLVFDSVILRENNTITDNAIANNYNLSLSAQWHLFQQYTPTDASKLYENNFDRTINDESI